MRLSKTALAFLLCYVVMAVASTAHAAFKLELRNPDREGIAFLDVSGLRSVRTPLGAPIAHFLPQPVSRPVARPVSQPNARVGRCYTEAGTPPAWVLRRENPMGNPAEWNHQGSSASGCWQFMPGTWGRYKGYRYAAGAPVSVQNERAKQVWAGGRGCSHWSAC